MYNNYFTFRAIYCKLDYKNLNVEKEYPRCWKFSNIIIKFNLMSQTWKLPKLLTKYLNFKWNHVRIILIWFYSLDGFKNKIK